jgi:hypothetical protein
MLLTSPEARPGPEVVVIPWRETALAFVLLSAAACAPPKVKMTQLQTMTPPCKDLGMVTAAGRDKKAIERSLQKQAKRRGGNTVAVTRAITKKPEGDDAKSKRRPTMYEYIGIAYQCAP